MYHLFKVGQEVTFPGLPDIRLIVVAVNENKGNLRCKYFDDYLKKFISLTLSADGLTPLRKPPMGPSTGKKINLSGSTPV